MRISYLPIFLALASITHSIQMDQAYLKNYETKLFQEPLALNLIGSAYKKSFKRSVIAEKTNLQISAGIGDNEGDGDVNTKAMETGAQGVEMMQKGLESGKMAANAGSDLAQSGKAGAEGLGSGAGMLAGGAETLAAGAGQLQNMAG